VLHLKIPKTSLNILKHIVVEGPKTLYDIRKEMDTALSSADLAIRNLRENYLIELDIPESRKRTHPSARVYRPTFKGLVSFLCYYRLKSPVTYQIRSSSENEEEAIRKFKERVRRERDAYRDQIEELEGILQKNGELLHYPLFQYFHSFEHVHPEGFIKIAEGLLREPPSRMYVTEKRLRTEKRQIERDLKKTEKLLKNIKFQISPERDGKETSFDPVTRHKDRLSRLSEYAKLVFEREDEFLRETYFVYFLMWFGTARLKLPNQELYDYTLSLLEKKKKDFLSVEKQLEKGLALFHTTNR